MDDRNGLEMRYGTPFASPLRDQISNKMFCGTLEDEISNVISHRDTEDVLLRLDLYYMVFEYVRQRNNIQDVSCAFK